MMSDLSRQRFIIHPAHSTIGVSSGLVAYQALAMSDDAAWETETRPLSVCFVSGSPHYESDQSLTALGRRWRGQFAIECARAYRLARGDLPGLENLARADCMVLFAQGLTIHGEQLNCLKRYCARGGSIVAIRASGRTMDRWSRFDREILGLTLAGNHGKTRRPLVQPAGAADGHPALEGVRPFVAGGSLFRTPAAATNSLALLTGATCDRVEPVAWIRTAGGGRIFCTTLGHPLDFRQPSFLRLLDNSLGWVTRRDLRDRV